MKQLVMVHLQSGNSEINASIYLVFSFCAVKNKNMVPPMFRVGSFP